MASEGQYYVTESEVSRLFDQSGLPKQFSTLFTRDYVSLKTATGSTADSLESLGQEVIDVEARVTINEAGILELQVRVTDVEDGLDSHVSDNSAHNATGNIVGTNDYATPALGGTVKQATAVADSTASTVTVTITPTAPSAAYAQAEAVTWVNAINEHKAAINQLKTDLNAVITLFNSSLATERTALQRVT